MESEHIVELIADYQAQIAQLQWEIKRLLLSHSIISEDGEVISCADLEI